MPATTGSARPVRPRSTRGYIPGARPGPKQIAARRHRASGFTLIELMVVVAIIALLLAVLLPAFGVVRQQARYAQSNAMVQGINTGIATFQSEQALANLPPSTGDNPDWVNRQRIANPKRSDPPPWQTDDPLRICGGMLLVHAMVGADGLGTPGFRDTGSTGTRDGLWWNDTHDDSGGLYELDDNTLQPKQPRYGGGGFVDDKMKEQMRSLNDLGEQGVILNLAVAPSDLARDEAMFVDPWDTPFLYYRANRAAVRMIGEPNQAGIYRQEDNGIITGTENGTPDLDGLDFGAGKVEGAYHAISNALPPSSPDPKKVDIGEANSVYDNTFARFIWDRSIKARYTPVNKDTYLLISAGPDRRYGTDDDVTNWTREDQ